MRTLCFFLLLLLSSEGSIVTPATGHQWSSPSSPSHHRSTRRRHLISNIPPDLDPLPQMDDVENPVATVPVINPSNGNTPTPVTTFPSFPPPASFTPTPINNPPDMSAGGSWCVASPAASPAALQVALDYACGLGGADCGPIQPGASCFNPDTVRDHASFAFNDYYQKNPVPTSCDFAGTAVLTSVNPSTPTCQYPSTSTSTTILNTTNPIGGGTGVFGGIPPPPDFGTGSTTSNAGATTTTSIALGILCLLITSLLFNVHNIHR